LLYPKQIIAEFLSLPPFNFPENVGIPVIPDTQNRSIELSIIGNKDSIRTLARRDGYEARVWCKNFSRNNNTFFADVLKIDIVAK
jgi:hypothetical protein